MALPKPLSPAQLELIDWLLVPEKDREPSTATQWALDHGVKPSAVQSWKRESKFREQWFRRAYEVGATPDNVREVLDALLAAARDNDSKNQVAAARAFLEYAQKATPLSAPPVEDDVALSDLSDQELDELIAEQAVEAKLRRAEES